MRFQTSQNEGFYHIDSIEGAWNTGRVEEGGNRGYKPRYKGGYFPVPPMDHYADLRDQMTAALIAAGIGIERAHHEVGTAGQAEINYRFNTLTHAADEALKFKYIVKNVAWANGKTATFMPKPLFGDNGSGMHCHQSLWKEGAPLFYDELGYAGLVRHRAALHRRAVAPRAVAARVHEPDRELLSPTRARLRSSREPRIQLRKPVGMRPDPDHRDQRQGQANRVPDPGLVLQPVPRVLGMLLAGVDGIRNKIEPPAPVDKDLYELPPDEAAAIAQVPGSLDEVLIALEADNEYLQEGGVFTADVIDAWITYKRTNEIDPIRLRPHPHEFELYYDV